MFNFNLKTYQIIASLITLEALSLLSYFFPVIQAPVFIIVLLAVLVLALIDLRYGLALALIEVIVGSQGYLLSADIFGVNFSLRLGLFLIIMAVWLAKVICQKSFWFKLPLMENWWWLAVIFIIALLIGLANGNKLQNIFFDANGFLYLLLLLPALSAIQSKDFTKFGKIGAVTLSWLIAKTYLLLFIFSHNLFGWSENLYGWLRHSLLGEATLMGNGFFRLFFQSHIFVLLAAAFILVYLLKAIRDKDSRSTLVCSLLMIASLGILVMNLSRSFWLALFLTLIIFLLSSVFSYSAEYKNILVFCRIQEYIKHWRFKAAASVAGLMILSSVAAVLLIVLLVRFPYPEPVAEFNFSNLSERIRLDDAAAAARWALLPKLWQAVAKQPILGQGLGATVTYQSTDPRILTVTTDGNYTTFAFEWGWLDLWLKFGLPGLLIWLAILGRLFWLAQKSNKVWLQAWSIGLIALVIAHVFTPYLNHPLGLAYLIGGVAFLAKE